MDNFWEIFHAAWGADRGCDEKRSESYDKNAWIYVQVKLQAYFKNHPLEPKKIYDDGGNSR